MLRAEIHSSFGEAGHRNGAYDEMPLLNAFISLSLFRNGAQILLAGNIEVLSGRSIHGTNRRPRHGYSAVRKYHHLNRRTNFPNPCEQGSDRDRGDCILSTFRPLHEGLTRCIHALVQT
jgi:hypothetical protein